MTQTQNQNTPAQNTQAKPNNLAALDKKVADANKVQTPVIGDPPHRQAEMQVQGPDKAPAQAGSDTPAPAQQGDTAPVKV